MRWFGCTAILVLLSLLVVNSVSAHADLLDSNPPANSALDTFPSEIRLTFSEPLEPTFSKIEVYNSDGKMLDFLPAEVVGGTQLVLDTGLQPEFPLGEGIYTIAWHVFSTKDGHVTEGRFAFSIGDAVVLTQLSAIPREKIPLDSVVLRWFNFTGFALGLGVIGFYLLVLRPHTQLVYFDTEDNRDWYLIDSRLWNVARLGWVWMFLGTVGMFVWQLDAAGGLQTADRLSFLKTITTVFVLRMLLIRFAFLLVLLSLLVVLRLRVSKKYHFRERPALFIWGICTTGILATQSLFSHASSVPVYSFAAVLADWLHLLPMTLWMGGLVGLLVVTLPLLRSGQIQILGRLVAYFSNYARILVLMLMLTGIYAAWLHVGRLDGLTTTAYGRSLLLKLILILPVLGLAGVNFLLTQRGLQRGELIWGKRLRWLTGMELFLLVGILGAVGVMTAISPARNNLVIEKPVPFQKTVQSAGLDIQLDLSTNVVGENIYTVMLRGNRAENVSEVDLVFAYQTAPLGTTEIQLEPQGSPSVDTDTAIYTAQGVELSAVGAWLIEVTIRRGTQPPIKADFGVQIKNRPTPRPLVSSQQEYERGLLGIGIAMLLGSLGLVGNEARRGIQLSLRTSFPLLFTLAGGVFVMMSFSHSPTTQAIFESKPNLPSELFVLRDHDLPFLLTADGDLYEPVAPNSWEVIPTPTPVAYTYVDAFGQWWICGSEGVFIRKADSWRQLSDQPSHYMIETHGYLYVLGQKNIIRLESGKTNAADIKELQSPLPPADSMVMLGNHTHILESDGQAFQTLDLGLSWETLDIPDGGSIQQITTDIDGNLLAVTSSGIQKWDTKSRLWIPSMSLPDGQNIEYLAIFGNRLYSLAAGKVYVRNLNNWELADLPTQNTYFTGMAIQYPDRLWVLDASGMQLWSTLDGKVWEPIPINLS